MKSNEEKIVDAFEKYARAYKYDIRKDEEGEYIRATSRKAFVAYRNGFMDGYLDCSQFAISIFYDAQDQPTVMPQLAWNCTNEIRLDDSIMFGNGFDFFGLENLRREAKGPNGNYLMWPSNGKWSLYRDTDGALAIEKYSSREECEAAAESWCADGCVLITDETGVR